MRTILRGGTVVQVGRRVAERADVVIENGLIVGVGRFGPADAEVIDVSGLVVCPGFVDAHVHAEGVLAETGGLEPALAQGVTTLVLGQDGCSWAPVSADTWAVTQDYFAAINGRAAGPPRDLTVRELLDDLDGCAQNVAYLVPHGNLRSLVTSSSAPLDAAALVRAVRLLEQGLEGGAAGLSSGLDYIPGRYGDTAELAALCEPLRAGDKVYASHLRAATADVDRAMGELIDVGARAGVRVHASHLRARWDRVEPALARADARGVTLTYDSYPYLAAMSLLRMYVLPPRMGRDDLRTTTPPFDRERLSRMTISYARHPSYRAYEGLTITEAASRAGRPVADFVVALLYDSRLEVSVIVTGGAATSHDIVRIATGDRHCGGSDGIYLGSRPHPRGYAAFTSLLRIYLDDGGGWLTAADHLAARPAEVFGLAGRGDIQPGYAADLAVFDEAAIEAPATYEQPTARSRGLRLAFVNGELAWSSGSWTGSRSGVAIR
ncbi:amidohydrolase family protein [Actinoplanes sp. NPDC049265]|uniref:N-acyl-D-amino-acid deacylase family protein n=1 Tax=Actinoplanes sp. NPDC049265 TaxID=3363902 RepID=UPI0037122A8D